MIGRTTCSRLEVSRECGIYEITTRRDRDQLVNLAKALTNSGAAGSANVTWLEETKTEQVSLESSTMLPHDYIITRTLTATKQQNGLTVPMINVERIHSVYTYFEER